MLEDLGDGFGAHENAKTRLTMEVSFAIDGAVVLSIVIGKLEPQPRARRECRIPNVSDDPLTSIFAQDRLSKLERKIAHNKDKLVRWALRS
jgi:hypothetical protein